MWSRRRHEASRRASETENLTAPMQQVSVERWLEEQNAPGHRNQFSQDVW